MAIFSHIQHPWSFTFGILGNIISFMVFLAPVPTFYRIVKKKSTEGFQAVPYVVALFSCMIWIYYATVKSDATLLITINTVGCVIETIYIAIYIAYAPRKNMIQTIKMVVLLDFVGSCAVALSTHYLVKGQTRVEALGWICLAISVSVFAAPLSIMTKVIRTKSVEYMPIGLSFFLVLSAVMWFFYGLLQKDFYVALPNIIGFVLGLVQMVLYMIYRNYKKTPVDDIEKKMPTPISTPEVHPVPCNLPNYQETAKLQTAALQCAHEVPTEVTNVQPTDFGTVQPINALIVDSTSSIIEEEEVTNTKEVTKEPTTICMVQPINALTVGLPCTATEEKVAGKKATDNEPPMGCTVQPINGLQVCASLVHPGATFEDHSQKNGMEAPSQVYLIESAA